MILITINSQDRHGMQRAQFDLPNHNGQGFYVGDIIDAEIFMNLGPITIKKRYHYPSKNLTVVECEGSKLLQTLLVHKYPNIEDVPNSAQIPPQDWKSL